MVVSSEVARAYSQGGASKILQVSFPDLGLQLDNRNITEESFYLRESILENDSIEFVGCVSSRMELEIFGIAAELKGQWVEVSIHTANTASEPIMLFHGIVDTCERKANSNKKSLTAYDQLYEKGKGDVSAWYNGLQFPITLVNLRNSLFSHLGIEQAEISLPNDSVSISRQYAPTSLKAINVIKAICQINGAFGIINRENVFEYRILQDIFQGEDAYPPLYPPYYPGQLGGGGQDSDSRVDLDYYRDMEYQEYTVKPVDKLTIRQSDMEEGISYGDGKNNYIIQGNMFTLGLDQGTLRQIAANIYDNIAGVEFRPFTADNNGLPYLEVGKSSAKYIVKDYATASQVSRARARRAQTFQEYVEKVFYMFTRELKGIQALQDTYNAAGEEFQTEFISDLQTQIDFLKNGNQNALMEYTYSKDEIENMVKDWYRIVDTKPSTFEQGVIYFVRK